MVQFLFLEKKIDAGFRDRQLADRQRTDRLVSAVQQSVASSLQGRVDRVVKQEIKNVVIPSKFSFVIYFRQSYI